MGIPAKNHSPCSTLTRFGGYFFMDNRKIDKDLRKLTSVIRLKGLDVFEMLEEMEDEVAEEDRRESERTVRDRKERED